MTGKASLAGIGLVLLAGCFGDSGPPLLVNPQGPASPTSYGYDCPPGASLHRRPEICVGVLETDELPVLESDHVAALAIDPENPSRLVVVVEEISSPDGLNVERPLDLYDFRMFQVFVSEDGGASWQQARVPDIPSSLQRPDGSIRQIGVTDLFFGPAGEVQISGYVTEEGVSGFLLFIDRAMDAFVMTSRDGGRSWGEPIFVSNDHLTISGLFSPAPHDGLYLSVDGPGRTKEKARILLRPFPTAPWDEASEIYSDCHRQMEIVQYQNRTLVSCSVDSSRDDCAWDALILQLPPASSVLEPVGTVECANSWFPHLLSAGDDGLLVVATEKIFRSQDGGRNWQGPWNVLELSSFADDWWLYDQVQADIDPWGHLHLVLGGEVGRDLVKSWDNLGHFVLETKNLTLLQEQRLLPDNPPYADPDVGLAFSPDSGVLMWRNGKDIDFTIVRPMW